MSKFEKKPPEELKEIAEIKRGRDFERLREKMRIETEKGIEDLLAKDKNEDKGK